MSAHTDHPHHLPTADGLEVAAFAAVLFTGAVLAVVILALLTLL